MRKHLAVLDPLERIIHLTRIADRTLTQGEEVELKVLCPQFLAARKGTVDTPGPLRGKPPTPKDMAIAYDIPYFAALLHTIGLFGTDGLEHLHQMITAAKAKTASIRNLKQRAKSSVLNIQRTQQVGAMTLHREAKEEEERAAKKKAETS